MSKIEEMAKAYRGYREECGVGDPVMLDEIEDAYYEGANAVLEEIEKQIDSYDWDAHPITNFERLKNKIKQLKGGEK